MMSWKRFSAHRSSLSTSVVILMLVGIQPTSAQQDTGRGDWRETRYGLLKGNQVGTVFYNFGEFGDWMNFPWESFDWPTGSGHFYIDGTAFMIQARAVTSTGRAIHPLETNYFEYVRYDPLTLLRYGWYPIAGYARAVQKSVAASNDSTTWPAHWPDKPADWDGYWNGYFGKGVRTGLTETYFVMDDNSDKGYIGVFHSDSLDTTRGGLGVKVRVRALEWSAPQLQDILFVSFAISNEGTTSYDSMYAAEYVDYAIGGHDNSSNNFATYHSSSGLFIAHSSTSVGLPGNWSPVGVLGIAWLGTPDSIGLTGVQTFTVHAYDLDNDELNWTAISSRAVVLCNTTNTNAACYLSSGPFTLAAGHEQKVVLAYIFAYDTAGLIVKADFARQFYKAGFDTKILGVTDRNNGLPGEFLLEQNFPNPFNPTTLIRYRLSARSHVTMTVFNPLGQQVAILVNEVQEPGYHDVRFDASGLATGVYFYRLRAGEYVQSRMLILLK
jgi:hypothetical protein